MSNAYKFSIVISSEAAPTILANTFAGLAAPWPTRTDALKEKRENMRNNKSTKA